LIKRSEIELK